MNKRATVFTGLIAAALAFSLIADDAFAAKKKKRKKRKRAATSQVVKSEVQPSFLDKVGATYYGNFYGPAINSLDSNHPDDTGAVDGPIFLYNSAKATYKVSQKSKVWLNPRWIMRPAPGNSDAFTLLDPRIGISTSKWIDQDGFTISPSIDLEIAATDSSRQKNRVVAPRLWLTNNYNFENSRFSVGGYLAARYFIRTSGFDSTEPKLGTYFAPWVAYQLSPTVQARLMYEAESYLNDRAAPGVVGTVTAINNLAPNFQPGVSWDITPSVNFLPYLRVFTSDGIKAESTAAGFELSAAVL